MKCGSVEPVSWRHVGLAVLPGIWLILQHNIDAPPNSSPLREGLTVAFTILIALGMVLASLYVHRRLQVWCLPVVGMLLWKADELFVWWSWAVIRGIEPASSIERILEHSGVWSIAYRTLLVLAVFGIAICILWGIAFWLWRLFRSRDRLPGWSWALLGLLVLLVFGTGGLFLLPLSLVAAGSLLSPKQGLGAALLYLAAVPEWLTFHLLRGGLYPAIFQAVLQQSPTQARLGSILSVVIDLSFLCFLVAVPIGFLRSCSKRQQLLWLCVPTLLTLASVAVISTLGLRGVEPEAESVSYLITRVVVVLMLWLPLPWMAVLYHSQYHHAVFMSDSSVVAIAP